MLKFKNSLSKKNKYGNIKTAVDGIMFDSKAESTRYIVLKNRMEAGLISELQIHVPIKIHINNILIGKYIADFTYKGKDGRTIVEDVKNPVLAQDNTIFAFKKRCIQALYNIDIRVIHPDKVYLP